MQIAMTIPSAKLKQFDECLKQAGGRYVHNPLELWGKHRVEFEFDSGNPKAYNFMSNWERLNRDIVEIPKQLWIKKKIASLKKFFN